MARDTFIGSYLIDCPICDEVHEVEILERTASAIIKGEKIEYLEKVFHCINAEEEESAFETGKLANENLLRARNAYRRQHGLLTSDEIVSIREMYGLSQVELSRLLGWGEATISRYESKSIQEEVYDNTLRMIKENPLAALELLKKNKDKFPSLKYFQIQEELINNLDSYGKEYLSRQALEGAYACYTDDAESSGNATLNIDKIECIISYIAGKVNDLYKVKLMKMLWYIDALSFKNTGSAITGLVYRHNRMGALPVAHDKIIGLENVSFEEEEIDSSQCDVAYRFLENENVNKKALSKKEYEIVDCVIEKFKSYTGKRLKEYMHEETAYSQTQMNEIIPFSLAREIRSF